jgi:energy-coupling factor transporter transmembrane protein EcfT
MFVPFLSAIIRYGYELSDGLTARGYDQIESRTTYVEVRHNRVDYVVYVVAIVVLAFALVV